MSENQRAPASERASSPDDASQPASEDVLDWEAAIEQNDVGEEVIDELAGLFLQESPKWLAEMRDALTRGDRSRLRWAAHTLKGSAAVFAARRTAEAALRLETVATEGELSQAEAVYADLMREVDRLRAVLALRAETPSGGGA